MAEHKFALSGGAPAVDLQRRRPDVDTRVHHERAVGTRAPAVLIAEVGEIPRLKRQTGFGRDLLVFSDSESLRAYDAIMQLRPSLVVLSELFAATRRGAELIGRIQTDETLTHCQIRVLSDAGDYLLLVAERVTAGSYSTVEEPGGPCRLSTTARGRRNASGLVMDSRSASTGTQRRWSISRLRVRKCT